MNDTYEDSFIFSSVLSLFETCLKAQLRAIRDLKNPPPPRPPRPGSQPALAYTVLRECGHPLHIDALLAHIQQRFGISFGRDSLTSSLSKKVVRCDRFVRVAQNTFGLREWESTP
jgi:hypothetical protein